MSNRPERSYSEQLTPKYRHVTSENELGVKGDRNSEEKHRQNLPLFRRSVAAYPHYTHVVAR